MANQNIIEKQQVRGSSASIAKYAGKEGQIVFNKDNKRLHVMSGTAGQSTQYLSTAQAATKTQLSSKLDTATYNSEKANFATKSQIPDTSTLATKAEVTSGLANKVNTSTYTADKATFALKTEIPDTSGLATKTQLSGYATTTALTQGLAGKLDTTGKAASATVADSANAVAWANVSGKPTIPDTSTLVPKSGARGTLAGYQSIVDLDGIYAIDENSADSLLLTATAQQFHIPTGTQNTAWTKVVYIGNQTVNMTFGNFWFWTSDSAPTLQDGLLVLHWHGGIGLLNFIPYGTSATTDPDAP